MLKPNKTYVIEKDGSIHEMIFVGDSDWEEKSTTSIQEIRNNALDEAINKFLEYGCVAVEWNKELSISRCYYCNTGILYAIFL